MLAFILLGTLLGPAAVPSAAARPAAAVVSSARGSSAAAARNLSSALLSSLTPAQLASLRPGGSLVLFRDQVSESQRQLIQQLALALGASGEPAAFAVRLVTTAGGAPALALSARGAAPAEFLATRPLALVCHW